MPDFQQLLQWMDSEPRLRDWAKQLPNQVDAGLAISRWGDLPAWQAVLNNLPEIRASSCDFSTAVRIGRPEDLDEKQRQLLKTTLLGLHPWRKGPWQLFGLDIDTEWRSDWKWDRLAPHLGDISNHRILDIGCGNGYHCMRLYGAGAERVIGIDPSAKFIYQFQVFKKYYSEIPVDVLPLGIEHIPANLNCFNTVLSMGVIYHRKDPQAHILELKDCLAPGGQIILETLIVEGDESLVPKGRYAKMRNVWCVPCPKDVLQWLANSGLTNPRMVDLCTTTIEEQRRTEWMHFESLENFLDPDTPSLTVEGHPAPKRAIFIADAP